MNDYRSTPSAPLTEPALSRYSAWSGAAFVGCAVALFVAAGDIERGTLKPLAWYLVWATCVATTVLAAWHMGGALIGGVAYGAVAYIEWRESRPRMPALADAAPIVAEIAEPDEPVSDPELEQHWRSCQRVFFSEGDWAGGFSYEKLKGVIGSDGHEQLTRFYRGYRGLLVDYPGNRGHDWGPGWDLARVTRMIDAGALPHPAGQPPEIHPRVHIAAQRRASRRTRKGSSDASGAVIEN